MTVEKSWLRKFYGQQIFLKESFGETMKVSYSVLMTKVEGGEIFVQSAKVSLSFPLRCGRKGKDKEATSVQYIEVKAPSVMVEKNLSFICMWWSNSDKFNHSVSGNGLEAGSFTVGCDICLKNNRL